MRIRQHVNPNTLKFETFRGELPPLDPTRETEVEIGCADAQFLFERAAKNPNRTYVGLEIREELVVRINQQARNLRTPVYGVFCQAQLHLGTIFGDAKVDRVFLNFPDPWFKTRHHERRRIDARLAAGLAEICKPGAEVFIQSDVWEVALDAMNVFERAWQWFDNQAGEWTFWKTGNPYGVRSWREQNAEETGLEVWRALFRRRA